MARRNMTYLTPPLRIVLRLAAERKRVRRLRIAAAQAIGRVGGEAAREILEENAARGDSAVQQACLSAIEQLERTTERRRATGEWRSVSQSGATKS